MNSIILILILLIKKPNHPDYSYLAQEIETNPKAPKLVRIGQIGQNY